jgi:hypothetical protein
MKRIRLVLLVLAVAFVMTACSGGKDSDSDKSGKKEQEVTTDVTKEPTKEPTKAEVKEPDSDEKEPTVNPDGNNESKTEEDLIALDEEAMGQFKTACEVGASDPDIWFEVVEFVPENAGPVDLLKVTGDGVTVLQEMPNLVKFIKEVCGKDIEAGELFLQSEKYKDKAYIVSFELIFDGQGMRVEGRFE